MQINAATLCFGMRSRHLLRALLALLLSAELESAYATDDRSIELARAEPRMARLISHWEDAQRTTTDPRLSQTLAGELLHFVEVFGFDYSTRQRQKRDDVFQRLEGDEWIGRALDQHLDDLAKGRRDVKTFFAYLASNAGFAAENAGWNSVVRNDYVLNDLSNQVNGKIILISNGQRGRRQLEYRRFLVGPGSHTLQSNTGETWTFDVAGPASSSGSARTSDDSDGAVPARGRRR